MNTSDSCRAHLSNNYILRLFTNIRKYAAIYI